MNSDSALSYLIGTLIDLYVTALLLRLLLQWVRADFYNPVCQFLVRITDPLVRPLRRLLPAVGKMDTASLVLMLALEVVSVWIISNITPLQMNWPQILSFAAIKLLMALLWTYFILIIVAVVLSWIGGRASHPVIPLVYQLTAPVLRPFRRVIPPIAGIDLSPLFALIAIRFIMLLLGW